MLTKTRVRASVFFADQAGINRLKDDFFDEARDFVCFRKGEWHGLKASVEKAIEWANANPDWVSTAVAMYAPARELLPTLIKVVGVSARRICRLIFGKVFDKRRPRTVTRQVICSPDVGKAEIAEWEDVCGVGTVVTIPQKEVGQFRYVVNEKRFAIFARLGPNNLQGIMGTDPNMIQMLRDRFDHEFIQALVRQKLARKKIRRK